MSEDADSKPNLNKVLVGNLNEFLTRQGGEKKVAPIGSLLNQDEKKVTRLY